jgi:predicted RNA binding protein YcfA (HicA-like mRNA interferase family)
MKALSAMGFKVARKHGSHVVMKHADGRITVIPVHAKENIGVGLLLKIIKDAKLEREEFIKLLA